MRKQLLSPQSSVPGSFVALCLYYIYYPLDEVWFQSFSVYSVSQNYYLVASLPFKEQRWI